MWQSQRSAKLSVIFVTCRVERHQRVVGIVASKEKDADEGLVGGRGSRLSSGVERPKRSQPGKIAGGGERGVLDEAATIDTHCSRLPFLQNACGTNVRSGRSSS